MYRAVLALTAACLLAGCNNMQVRTPAGVSRLAPTRDHQAEGVVNFTQKADKVIIEGKITGLTPGLHGFHIHEKGDCSAADASSAGPHFNPGGSEHGAPDAPQRHAGDLGNLIADQTGTAIYRAEIAGISLGTDANSIIGRAIVVHGGTDDLLSQPAGNSGVRVACGLISLSPDKWFHKQ
ncbi:MAG: superoxide dismutase family protein [Burkholderiales bacterium]